MKIHQVKTRLVNTYIVEYTDKLLIVDVAPRSHPYVLGFIETSLGRRAEDIALIVCTHDDPDHIGGVDTLANISNAKIGIPYASNAWWRKLKHDPYGTLTRLKTSIRELARARAWDMYFNPARNKAAKKKTQAQKINNDKSTSQFTQSIRLKHKQTLMYFEDWTILHTPGHSWDSCCFYHADSNSLLSGDTLLGSGKKNRLFAPAIYSNRKHMLKTLQDLSALNIEHVYPGHGSVISGSNIIQKTQLQ